MDRWVGVPAGLDLGQAAALPMAVETAHWHLECLGVSAGQTLLVNGAGTTVGFAAVQIGLLWGARMIATAGDTYAGRLRAMGAMVTSYGDGLAGRVTEAAGEPVDLVLDTAPPSGALPELIRAAGGDPRRVLTLSDFAAAAELGVRDSFHEERTPRTTCSASSPSSPQTVSSPSRSPGPSPRRLAHGTRHQPERTRWWQARAAACRHGSRQQAVVRANPNSVTRTTPGRRSSAFSRRLSRKGPLTAGWLTR
jgi:hypothetical protein